MGQYYLITQLFAYMHIFLNQARAWFLEIAFVQEVSMRVCVCVWMCVCVSASEAMNN